jgi:hypothetical protein
MQLDNELTIGTLELDDPTPPHVHGSKNLIIHKKKNNNKYKNIGN